MTGKIAIIVLWTLQMSVCCVARGRSTSNDAVAATGLTVEGRTEPLGLDVRPRFSWRLESDVADVHQKAYRIIVASHRDTLDARRGDVWDSGWTDDSTSLFVAYSGRDLRPNERCYWSVKVRTNRGETAWSSPSTFGMGLLQESNWRGQWIGIEHAMPWDREDEHSRLSARYYRKTFQTSRPIVRATLHIAGLGLYEAYVDGHIVDDGVMMPAPTDYRKTIVYNTFDVTDLLLDGSLTHGRATAPQDDTTPRTNRRHCLAVVVAPGRYYTMQQHYKQHKIVNFGYPTLRANLIVEYAGGRTETIATDYKTWRVTADGPIRWSNEYDGETYDARRDLVGDTDWGDWQLRDPLAWTLPDYPDSTWQVAGRSSLPTGTLRGNLLPPMQVVDTLWPRSVREVADNRYIVDFGQNVAGWVRLNIAYKGTGGDTLTVRYAERLADDGELYTDNLRLAESTDRYICSGREQGSWAPRFATHGFRYVEVTNYCDVQPGDLVAEVVADPMRQTGTFECAHPMLNRLVDNARRGIVGNYKGMPVDCPQRDERMPWLGDRAMGCWGESYLMNNHAMYAKWSDDIAESQREDGALPDVAPTFWNYWSDNVTWPSTFIQSAAMIYQQYGDLRPIKRHYEAMRHWLLHFGRDRRDHRTGLITADRYGDWCVPPESPELIHSQDPSRTTDGTLIASAYYYMLLGRLADFAGILSASQPARSDCSDYPAYSEYSDRSAGRLAADIALYERERDSIRSAFNRHYLTVRRGTSPQPSHLLYPDSVYYGNGSVTSNLLPLAFGIVPDTLVDQVARQVMARIMLKPADGHLTCGVVGMQWLMRELSRRGRTDIAYLLATQDTYPSWGYMAKHGATTIWELWNGDTANPRMNSGNHVMLLGDVLPWVFEDLGGLRATSPGYKTFRLAPRFELDALPWARVSYESPYGTIVSSWRSNTSGDIEWDIVVPPNTSADVVLPDGATRHLTSGRHHIDSHRKRVADPTTMPLATAAPSDRSAAAAPVSVEQEFVFLDDAVDPSVPFPSTHAATIAELTNGDLLCAYFGGTYEGRDDVCIYTSRKRRLADGTWEDGWSAPQMVVDGVLSDTLRKACYNPVLYQVPDGDLLLFFKIGKNVKDWTGYVVRSSDGGVTWSAREEGHLVGTAGTPADSLLGAIKNKPIVRNGKIIAPSSKELGGWRCYMEISDDGGRSWRLVGPIPQPTDMQTIQPTILEHADGRLQAIARTQKQNQRLATTWSDDDGETWTPMEYIDVPSNNSGVDAVTLGNSGTFLLIHNPTHVVPGPDKPLRNPLVVSSSTDGLHWHEICTLESSPIGQYAYPSAIVGSDGTVHIVYTWRRTRIRYARIRMAASM